MTRANPQQQKAIETTEGPVLIVAGPGSGKTFSLVERTVYLLKEKSIAPERILISTFTEKAAKELKTRASARMIQSGLDSNPLDLNVGTLHSIFLDLLEEFRAFTRINRSYTVLDQFDQQYFLYQNLSEFRAIEGFEDYLTGGRRMSSWRFAEKLAIQLNKVAEEAVSEKELEGSQHSELQMLGKAYAKYQVLLEQYNYLDFSTIQVEMLRLLENDDIKEEIQSRFHYLMIHEYQDTNTIQERIVLLLAAKHQNLCVVGDDDQALYRFRGASIRNILEFPKRFEKGKCRQNEKLPFL